MLFYRTFPLLGLILGALLCVTPAFSVESASQIDEVEVTGNERVHETTILYYISMKKGEPYSPRQARKDIKKLYGLGYFDDVQVEIVQRNGKAVGVYRLKEKPFITKVTIEGMEELAEKDIEEEIKLKKGKHFRRDLVFKDIETIKRIYKEKGYFFVEAKIVEKRKEGNQIELTIEIDEGAKIYVREIRFFGNKRYSDGELKKIMDTSEKGFFSALSESGTYRKDGLKADILKIETFYHNNGYIKVRVEDPRVEIDKERGSIYISIFMEEGEQYRVGKIEIEEDEIYREAILKKALDMKEGDIFDRSRFAKGIFEITDLYLRKGFAFADVIQRTKTRDEERLVDISVRVDRGNKVYIGQINISGNEKTRDKVIRREFRLIEGALFDSSKLRRSRERLDRLGYFEKVDIKQKSRSEDDLIDLDVEVTETTTGTLSIGAGYSSVEQAVFIAQISQRNFLGRGQKLAFQAEISAIRKDYSLSFTEPYLFDKDLSAGFRLFNTEVSTLSNFSTTNNGGGITLGKSLGEYSSGSVAYTYQVVDTFVDSSTTASTFLLAQEGKWTTSSVTPSFVRDSRNDFFSPSKGGRFSLNGTYAGGPLSGLNYYRLNIDNSYYQPLFWRFILVGHGRAGYVQPHGDDDLPIFENFYLGGSSSLRGFTFREVGPRDSTGEAIGGRSLLLFNAEIHYPFTRFVRAFAFYDRGQVYGRGDDISRTTEKYYDLGEMRHSWGAGVKFFSPVGPIALTWGFKLDPKPGESQMEFHFDVGKAF